MSRFTKRNLRKRTRSSRNNANQQARETRRENREESSGENVEVRNALNVPEEPEPEVTTHVCDAPTTYSSFVAFNSLSMEAVNKLRTDIEKLKGHLAAAHAELAHLSVENVSFRKTMSKYKKKVEFIDRVALGKTDMNLEPGTSTVTTFSEQIPSSSGIRPYPRATCTATVPDEEDDDSDDNDSDDGDEGDSDDDDEQEIT